ncbi:recombinase family protein [Micromonospora sp. WMMD980]|uniref:recombinase family protein n=1 Tax=Micromonospora sp. WMMD980 TaxID=3016088 RepID=UPI0024179798|nr:recombinase family protein [Micromonospora sp. WMMD980]MDG4801693.1 recombinase family protein [Micromonospora sp. WMMD980]
MLPTNPQAPALGRARLRASLYVRLSKSADDANTSLENMIKECRELVAREGFEEVALHVDDGISGGVRDRPEFIAWLNDARHGRADVLVAHHVDRMTREGLNVAAMILDVQEGKDHATGRQIHAPVRLMDTKGIDSNNGVAFRILFLIKAETAREERQRIKERQAGRATRLRLAGRWPGGEVPFGYQIVEAADGKGKTLALLNKEVDALEGCASRILDGHTLSRTVRWMNTHGVRPRRAPEWSRVTLRQALTGDHILGRVTIGGVVQRDAKGRALTPFPAALDLPTVVELRKALDPSPDPRKRTGRKPARLASRLIECSGCGHLLTVARTKTAYRPAGRPEEVRRYEMVAYRCQRKAEGKLCDRPVLVSALPFEAHLEARFKADFGHSPMVERRVIVADDGALTALEDDVAAVLASLAQSATPENFARLQALQAERDTLAAAPREPDVRKVLLGHTLSEEWDLRDTEGRRELLAEAYAALILKPGKRGGRGHFDPARLVAIPNEGEHDPDY